MSIFTEGIFTHVSEDAVSPRVLCGKSVQLFLGHAAEIPFFFHSLFSLSPVELISR